jgi:hypothetical protein
VRRNPLSDPGLVPVRRDRNPGNTTVRCPIDGAVVHFDTKDGRLVERCYTCEARKRVEARLAERKQQEQLDARRVAAAVCRPCPKCPTGRVTTRGAHTCDACRTRSVFALPRPCPKCSTGQINEKRRKVCDGCREEGERNKKDWYRRLTPKQKRAYIRRQAETALARKLASTKPSPPQEKSA